MSGNASLFIEIKKKENGSVTFGDKDMGKIISIDKISKDPSYSIDNVSLVDGLRFNLPSISQLYDKGNLVTFDSTYCMLKSRESKKINIYSPRIDNVYAIDINDIPSSNLACFKPSQHDEN